MKTLNIILGAGFSANAGLPLVGKLSSKIETDYKNKLIRWSSSEWKWAEGKEEGEIFSGRLGGEYISYEYMMNEIIRDYVSRYGPINNYEVFYDLLESAREEWFHELREKAIETYKTDNLKTSESVLNRLTILNKWNALEVMTYLIADSLVINKSLDEVVAAYLEFLGYLEPYEKVNIHTLNHDLLLENLFETMGMPFSDGFKKTNSELKSGEHEELIPTYQGLFDQNISLLKLHGSIDLIQYRVGNESGSVVTPTGRLIYFKPESFMDKHWQVRIDPETNEIVQKLPCEVIPKFITGLTKPRKIAVDYMYSDLFRRFQKNIATSGSELLVIGYSYGDSHINDIIQQADHKTSIININPGWKYPFKKYSNVKEFSYMEDEGAFAVLP